MKKYILALDQGTTASRAALFDRAGAIRGFAARPVPQLYPRPGWVEHDPKALYDTQLEAAKACMERAGAAAADIEAVGIANQRETTVVWDRETGEPVYNAIVWQCRRTAPLMDSLKESACDALLLDKTGLTADAYFSASKIKWILDSVPGARERAEAGRLLFGTVDSYLLYRLTGGRVHATDYTNASRTLLFDIHTLGWDDELLELFTVPGAMLPTVFPSGREYGRTQSAVFGKSLPILSVCGDQQAALYGQGCTAKGDIKNTYGTGCFLLMNTGTECVRSKRGLITSLAATPGDTPSYVLEGSVFVGGAVVRWLRDGLKLIDSAAESEAVARSVEDSGGVFVVPAFVGLGAPHWDSAARGIVTGITQGTDRAHIVRAALESIAYQVFDVLHAMERDLNTEVTRLNVDGGASQNNFLLQFQADILSATVVRPPIFETTALGAALLAGQTAGFYDASVWDRLKAGADVFEPACSVDKRRERLLGWSAAVARCKVK
ncbi:MAG: glycerol kinase GlpK [Clostridiales bacterium]|jgi:glycerol kinase|nr:glycerol kinase GlpK [Clostridiales bacterium]